MPKSFVLNRQCESLTLPIRPRWLRRPVSDNMYASIDLVTDMIRRKLRRFKERKVAEKRHRQPLAQSSEEVR